jgi:antitoxin component of RelBE/YafQ-DinJ toxin-antitoxin module
MVQINEFRPLTISIQLSYTVVVMSSTLLSIRTDNQTKRKIADFAASLGLSTSAFATAVLLQAVREQRVLLTPHLEPTPYLEALMKEAEADYAAGRNIQGPFGTADAMIADLEK